MPTRRTIWEYALAGGSISVARAGHVPSVSLAEVPKSEVSSPLCSLPSRSDARAADLRFIDRLVVFGFRDAGDGGGGIFRRIPKPTHAGDFQSADGSWWGYEPDNGRINVKCFGAYGTGQHDDTEAVQAAIDFARSNAGYPIRRGTGFSAAIYLPAGIYRITKSLDFTSSGAVYGLGICGDGQFQTQILGELSEAYPVIDASGMAYGWFENFQVRCERSSAASCCLLLANPVDTTFHNRNARVSNVHLAVASQDRGGSAIAAMIVQNADLLRTSNLICEGPKALICGARLPALELGMIESAEGRELILVAEHDTRSNTQSYEGLTLVLEGSHGQYFFSRILVHDLLTRQVRIDRDLPVAIRSASYSVYSVRSKYREIPSRPDQTNYWFMQSEFYGAQPVEFRGGATLSLSDIYLSAGGAGSNGSLNFDRTGLLIASIDQPSPVRVRAWNLRIENQTTDSKFFAITSDMDIETLEVSGELDIVPNDFGPIEGAVIRTRHGANISAITINGFSTLGAPLFALTGSVGGLYGTFRCDGGPGSVAGAHPAADRRRFDWINRSCDHLWRDF